MQNGNGYENQQASPAPVDPLNKKVTLAEFRVTFHVIAQDMTK